MAASTNPAAGERKRFTVEEVERMSAAGLLDDQDLELIDGDLVVRPGQSPPHAAAKYRLRLRLEEAYRDLGCVRDQDPLRVGDHDQPQPDLAVVPTTEDDYVTFHPRGSAALLVVEISATSLEYDHHKVASYARGSVPVVWIVNLDDRVLEVCSQPKNGRYTAHVELTEADSAALPGTTERVAVESLFP